MEFHRHSPCVRVQRQRVAGSFRTAANRGMGEDSNLHGISRYLMESRPAFAAICGPFKGLRWVRRQGVARAFLELPDLAARGGFEPPPPALRQVL